MKFTLLGSGTTIPDPARGPAGFLLERAGARVLVDGGTGTLRALAQRGVDCRDLDGGVYSHRHVDHCGDLVPLLFTLRVGADRPRTRDYPIWAGEGFGDYLNGLHALYPGWLQGRAWRPVVQELPLEGPGAAELPGGVLLETRPAVHGAGALHLRFTSPEGRRLVFSGDTAPSEALVELSAGVDVLVTECACPGPDPYMGHLWPEAILDLARRARPRSIVLTHFYPDVDEAVALRTVAAAGVPVQRGWDGQTLEL